MAAKWRKKEKNGDRRKSQKRYIKPPREGAISQAICTKFSELVDLTQVVMPTKFGNKIFIVFFQAERWKKDFPFKKPTAYKIVSRATALACDR